MKIHNLRVRELRRNPPRLLDDLEWRNFLVTMTGNVSNDQVSFQVPLDAEEEAMAFALVKKIEERFKQEGEL